MITSTPRIHVVPVGQNARVEHVGGAKPETVIVLDPQEQRELVNGLVGDLLKAIDYLAVVYPDAKPMVGDGGRERCLKQAIEDVIARSKPFRME